MKTLHQCPVSFCCAVLGIGLLFMPSSARAQATITPATPPAGADQPLVSVGGQTITQGEYQAKLEMAAGKAVLTKLVLTILVRQAATKASPSLMPTEKDIDARIADLQRTNPQQAQLFATLTGRDDLTTEIALENLRLQGVTASDAEIAAFYTKNKALFTVPSQVQTTMVVSQTPADSRRAELLLDQGVSSEAIARKTGLQVAGVNGFTVNMDTLPPAVRQKVGQTVLAMKPEQIKTIPVLGKYFLTFKVKSARATATPPLSQIKGQVARQVRLQKAISPQQQLAALYQADPPAFSDPRYQAYFGGGASVPANP